MLTLTSIRLITLLQHRHPDSRVDLAGPDAVAFYGLGYGSESLRCDELLCVVEPSTEVCEFGSVELLGGTKMVLNFFGGETKSSV